MASSADALLATCRAWHHGQVIVARQPDGRVLADREALAAATGRPARTIRRRCTPSTGDLYDLDHATTELADLPPPPRRDIALTAAEAERWLQISAATVRSWARRGDIHPAGRRGASPTYSAAHLAELARPADTPA